MLERYVAGGDKKPAGGDARGRHHLGVALKNQRPVPRVAPARRRRRRRSRSRSRRDHHVVVPLAALCGGSGGGGVGGFIGGRCVRIRVVLFTGLAKIFPRERQPRFFILELQSLDLDAIRRAIRDATVPNLPVAHPEPVPPPPRRLRRGDVQRRVRPTGIVVRRDEPSEQRAAIDEALGVDAPRALPGARARPLGGGGHRQPRGRVVSEFTPPGGDSRGARVVNRVGARADPFPRELKHLPRRLP